MGMMELWAQMPGDPGGGMMPGSGMMGPNMMGPGGMWFGPVIGLIILFLLIWFLVALIRSFGGDKRNTHEKSPLDILNERYARGEIGTEEYEERRKKLS